jgi:hypothetical protein
MPNPDLPSESRPRTPVIHSTDSPILKNFPAALWLFLGAVLVAVAILVHAIVPRYEWRAVDANGSAIVVYDRWTGRFQRAVWQEDSTIKAMELWAPF